MLLRTNIYVVIFIFIVELFMYFISKKSDLILQSASEYLMRFLVIPTIDNALIIIVRYILVKCLAQNSKLLNYIPTVQLALICLVVASIHYNFFETLCIFCIPFLITVIFSDKRMTWHVEIISCVFLGLALLIRKNLTVQQMKMSIF